MTGQFGVFTDFQGFNFSLKDWANLRDALAGRELTIITHTTFEFFDGVKPIGSTSLTSIAKLKFSPGGVDCEVKLYPGNNGSQSF